VNLTKTDQGLSPWKHTTYDKIIRNYTLHYETKAYFRKMMVLWIVISVHYLSCGIWFF